jgi:hypothetical protein
MKYFILISSCPLFAPTQQYFVQAGGVLMFGGSLSEGLCSLFWRRFLVIFGAIDTTILLFFHLWSLFNFCLFEVVLVIWH